MKNVFCIKCGNVQESKAAEYMFTGDLVWSESCNECGSNSLEVMNMKPTDLQEAQTEYKHARAENEAIKELCKKANAADYKKLDETQDKEEIKSLMTDISRRNGENGLYNSNTRLDVAENNLLKEAAKVIKHDMDKERFKLVDKHIFSNKRLLGIRRQQALELCLKVEA